MAKFQLKERKTLVNWNFFVFFSVLRHFGGVMEPIIELNLKSLTFPPAEKAVLHDIHFTVKEGEFVAVTGAPASGKSMFLHTLSLIHI